MSLQFIITDAGRAAIAQVGGAIGPVTLTKIALGSAGYTPLANRTALQTEIKRLDPSGSSVPVPGTISITAQDNSADSYSVKEIGLYTNNNVLFAICAQSAVIMTKASGSVALFAMDFVMTNVPAGTVTVGNVGFTYSQATETAMGVLGIATTAEAQAGAIDTKIITPLKLAQVTATETRKGVIALATTAEAQALAPDATKALTVARLVDRTATTSRVGVVELADNTETQTGTDATRAVTPASLASRTATDARAGIVELATNAETQAGTITTLAVTPAGLASRIAGTGQAGLVALATIDQTQTGTDTGRAVTPAGLSSRTATETRSGIVQLASTTEASEGTITTKAVTPAALKFSLAAYSGSGHTHAASAIVSGTIENARLTKATSSVAGIVELAANAETQTGTATDLAVTPAGLKSTLGNYSVSTHTHAASAIVSGTIDNARLPQAASSAAGIVELADNTETQTGTATNLAVTPASLASRTATDTRAGIVELADNTETQTGIDTARAVTPASLASRIATTSRAGIVELADNTETQAGTDTTRAVTPASLASRTATDARAGIVELATNAETQTGTAADRAVTPASLASAAALFVPPGAVLPFAMNVVPSGWLAANGAAVSRTTYASLFAAIGTLYGVGNGSTTFALPDLRGYFVRGSGTNADGTAAGTFGAKQADAFQGHRHEAEQTSTFAGPTGTAQGSDAQANSQTTGDPVTDTVNGTPRTASETRPKNIALLYCIKI
jgi:microcystin-dependent protein